MVELTEEQVQAMADPAGNPPRLVNPRTQEALCCSGSTKTSD